jgi:hypothetical protein
MFYINQKYEYVFKGKYNIEYRDIFKYQKNDLENRNVDYQFQMQHFFKKKFINNKM